MSEISFQYQPMRNEFFAHSTYLPDNWYQVSSSHRFKKELRMDGFSSLNVTQRPVIPYWEGLSSDLELFWSSNNIRSFEEEYGSFAGHNLPYTATNQGLKAFKSRGFSITDETESYMAELLTNNKNVKIVNSSVLDRVNGALTTKSEIDLGKMYANANLNITKKKNKLEYRDPSETNPVCHIDATTHIATQSPVSHTSDPDYVLGYDTLNNGQAEKVGPYFDPSSALLGDFGIGGARFYNNERPEYDNPIPLNWDYTKSIIEDSWIYAYYGDTFYHVRSYNILNGKPAFVFGDDLYKTNFNGFQKKNAPCFSVILVAKPSSVDEGKIFSNLDDGNRFLVHLPWQKSGAGYFDWMKPSQLTGLSGNNRLTFEVDMINPSVYVFTANKNGRAFVRRNGVTVASTSNATPHDVNHKFMLNGNYTVNGVKWRNPCFLGEAIFTQAEIMYDDWLPYERFLMRKWRIPHE